MARHLKRQHNVVWKKVVTPRIDDFMANINCKLSDNQIQSITEHFSICLAETSAPYRLVENEHFKMALQILNPTYKIPVHTTISRKIEDLNKQ